MTRLRAGRPPFRGRMMMSLRLGRSRMTAMYVCMYVCMLVCMRESVWADDDISAAWS